MGLFICKNSYICILNFNPFFMKHEEKQDAPLSIQERRSNFLKAFEEVFAAEGANPDAIIVVAAFHDKESVGIAKIIRMSEAASMNVSVMTRVGEALNDPHIVCVQKIARATMVLENHTEEEG